MKQSLLTKGILVIALMLVVSTAIAQKKKEKTKDKKESQATIEIAEDVDLVEEISVSFDEAPTQKSSTGPIKMVSNIRFNKQYETYSSITNDYDWFYDRYASGDRKFGIVNKAGDVILPNLFNRDYTQNNSVLLRLEDRYGIYDLSTLRWTVPIEYESIRRLNNNNLFIAKKGGKYGLIDNNNVQVMAFEWTSIESISGLDHYVIVRGSGGTSEKQYGIYSIIEKRLTVPCRYSSLARLSKKLAFKVQDGSKFNVVDIQNVAQFKQWYDDMQTIYSDPDHYIVKLKDRYGIIDDNEQAIVPIEYMEIDKSQYSDGSHLARNKAGKYGFIRLDGQVTLPFIYDNLKKEYGSSNMISVQNEKCGLVQVSSGIVREIVTCDFDNIKGLNNVFIVEKNQLYGLLNESGKPLTEIEYQSVEMLTPNSGSLLICAKKDNTYILLNLMGKPLSNSKYEEVSIVPSSARYNYDSPKFNYIKAREKGSKYSLVDQVGIAITKPIFDDVVWEGQNMAIVKSKGKYGIYYILNQKLVVEYKYDQIVNGKDYFIGFTGNSIDLFKIESGNLIIIDSKK